MPRPANTTYSVTGAFGTAANRAMTIANASVTTARRRIRLVRWVVFRRRPRAKPKRDEAIEPKEGTAEGWVARSVERGDLPLAGVIGDEAARFLPELTGPTGSRGCGVVFLVGILAAAAIWGGGLGWFVWQIEVTQTKIQALSDFQPKMGSKFFADGEILLGEYMVESRRVMRLDEIPLILQKAFIATEDDRFYEHRGVRPDAIANAAKYILETGKIRGGSTITQQLVRNVEPLPVGQSRTLHRKLTEAVISLQVERRYTKDEILELYLNQLFLGGSAYGVEAASQQYYGKSCQDVTIAEAAMLAGLARSPNKNRPDREPENARARRRIVLEQMLANGFITPAEFEAADRESLVASLQTDEELVASLVDNESEWRPNEFLAPYFCEATRVALRRDDLVNKQELLEAGLEVYTTIDMDLQAKAGEIFERHLQAFDENKRRYYERAGRADEFVPVSGGLVVLDNRPGMQGFVRAMFGGRDYDQDQFNTVTQAKRQPGSSVKPFMWTMAMNQGMTPETVIVDAPISIQVGAGKYWTPRNFGGDFSGPITLRRALEKSINIVSVKLVLKYGRDRAKDTLQEMGIRTPIQQDLGLTIALGSLVVDPLEQCAAYATFANGGLYYAPTMIEEIKFRDGITKWNARPQGERVLDENIAYVMTNIMEGVARHGTGARSAALDRPRAGKTGTTNDARDVWFCGYTPQYTCVVWIGYRDYRSLGSGPNYTGGRLACPVWTEVMIEAHKDLPVQDFAVPPNIAFRDAGNGFRHAFIQTGGGKPPLRPVKQPEPEFSPASVTPAPAPVPKAASVSGEGPEDLLGPLFEGFDR